jgi:hypothetical protein
MNCEFLSLAGHGTVTIDVMPYPGLPGAFEVAKETVTFVPEPTTLSLFALGLVGVPMQRKAIVP